MRKLFSARARVGVEREPASYGSTGLQADKEMLPHHFRGGITRVSTAFSLKAAPGSPALCITRVNRDQHGRIIDCDVEYWRHDAVRVSVAVPD